MNLDNIDNINKNLNMCNLRLADPDITYDEKMNLYKYIMAVGVMAHKGKYPNNPGLISNYFGTCMLCFHEKGKPVDCEFIKGTVIKKNIITADNHCTHNCGHNEESHVLVRININDNIHNIID